MPLVCNKERITDTHHFYDDVDIFLLTKFVGINGVDENLQLLIRYKSYNFL